MKVFLLFFLTLCVTLDAATIPWKLSAEEKAFIEKKPTINVCTNPSLMPFEVLTPEGKHEGIAADLLSIVAERVGLDIEIIQTYTWEESLLRAKRNECDIISFISQTPDYDEWLLFSEPLLIDKNILITREDHHYIGDLKYVASASLALPRGSAIFDKVSTDFPNITLFSVASEEDALMLVASKKVDMTIRSLALAAYSIKQQGLFNLKLSGKVEGVESVFRVGITQNNTVLRDILNKGIQSISLRERETIVNRYIPSIIQQEIGAEVWYALGSIFLVICSILLWNYMLRKEVKREIARNIENQKMMMQQAKKAALGELIGNISHQWREPLSQLSGINLMMIGLIEHNKEISQTFLHQQLKHIENTLDFMSQTMQNFLEFYKPSTVLQHFNICDSIEQTLSIVETNLLSNAIIVSIEGDKDKVLYGIKNEYMQIWLNLLNNAIHAFSHKEGVFKKVTIRIDEDVIIFCDNAGGHIESSDFSKGVGLMMCQRILNKYRHILVVENKKEGVCIKIELKS